MGNFAHTDIPECEALFRQATVVAVDGTHRTLDIKIGETVHAGVEVHYHCPDADWYGHSHPHSYSERDQMMGAFNEDDEVLVLCDDEAKPLYVVGFPLGVTPKPCPAFILVTQTALNVRVIKDGYFPGPSYWANFAYIEASGEVLGITTDGPTPAIDKDLIISCGGGNTLYINDIEITDGIWNYENWFAQTGWPETWKNVCFASEEIYPQLTIESLSYSYFFYSAYFSYLRYTDNLSVPEYEWVIVAAIFEDGSYQANNYPASAMEWWLSTGTDYRIKHNYDGGPETKTIYSLYQLSTEPPGEGGNPATLGIRDYHLYFSVTESDLEELFGVSGLQAVERDFLVTWEGIDEHLL